MKNKNSKIIVVMIILSLIAFNITNIYALPHNNEIVIEVSDSEGIWQRCTDIDVFKASYFNDKTDITINSDNSDKIIAPGSQNKYIFKVKNISDLPVDYTLHAKFNVTPQNISIPIYAKIQRHDNKWVMGSHKQYSSINTRDSYNDKMTLSSLHYAYYTLEWIWPYDTNDNYDTRLGDLSIKDDIHLTLTIDIVAKASHDKDSNGGLLVETGDLYPVYPYILLSCLSIFSGLLLIKIRKVKKK